MRVTCVHLVIWSWLSDDLNHEVMGYQCGEVSADGAVVVPGATDALWVGCSPKTLREIVANQSANSPFNAYRLTARGVEAWVGDGEG